MNIYKVTVDEIEKDFNLKGLLELWPDYYLEQKLALRGLEAPSPRSRRGKAMRQHMQQVFESVPFLALTAGKKNARLRYLVDLYYLPGEKDLERIVAEGRHLNQELLKLDLAEPFDENRRKVDFSQKSIQVFDEQIDLVTGNFKSEVCMYINDCKQYLRAALGQKPVDMEKTEFEPTDEEFLIIYGLKEVKEMSMMLAGRRPLDWKGH